MKNDVGGINKETRNYDANGLVSNHEPKILKLENFIKNSQQIMLLHCLVKHMLLMGIPLKQTNLCLNFTVDEKSTRYREWEKSGLK